MKTADTSGTSAKICKACRIFSLLLFASFDFSLATFENSYCSFIVRYSQVSRKKEVTSITCCYIFYITFFTK